MTGKMVETLNPKALSNIPEEEKAIDHKTEMAELKRKMYDQKAELKTEMAGHKA